MKRMKKEKNWATQEMDAIGVVEMVLILAVLLGLIIIFRTQLTMIVQSIFSSITQSVDQII